MGDDIIGFQIRILYILCLDVKIPPPIRGRNITLRNGTRYQDEIISPFRSLQYIFHITGIINQTGTLEITKRRQTVENIIDPVAVYQLVLPDKSGSKISAGIRILVLSHIHPGIPHRIIDLQTGIVHCKIQLPGSVQKSRIRAIHHRCSDTDLIFHDSKAL